ncbi:MAG TPA: type 4a pilus biogenesis protein PilO [Acidimicrobiales bacterium]|nr:type 4a pilus biogenesis protein PilO [Acidimicrobiales bacterium]
MRGVSRRVLIGGGAGLLLVLVLWLVLLWLPRNNAYNQASRQASQAEAQASQLQAQLSRLQSDARQQPLLQAELLRLQAAIPDDPDLAQFILDLNDAANQAGVNLLSISPSPPVATGATSPSPGATAGVPPAIKVSLNVTGGYFQVLDFLDRLDTLSRLLVIDTMSMNHSAGGGTAGSQAELTVAITARMFTAKPLPVGPSTGVATTTTTTVAGATTTTTAAGGAATTTSTSTP